MSKKSRSSLPSPRFIYSITALTLIGSFLLSWQSLQPQPAPAITAQPQLAVQAQEPIIDRTDPDWLEHYCEVRIQEVATITVPYERSRGPFRSFQPMHHPERLSGYRNTAVCTLDYYYWPTVEDTYAALGVEYTYAEATRDRFNTLLLASVSAQLADQDFIAQPVYDDTGYVPDIMASRYISGEGITEHIDAYITKDEEIIFELLVTAQ